MKSDLALRGTAVVPAWPIFSQFAGRAIRNCGVVRLTNVYPMNKPRLGGAFDFSEQSD